MMEFMYVQSVVHLLTPALKLCLQVINVTWNSLMLCPNFGSIMPVPELSCCYEFQFGFKQVFVELVLVIVHSC